MQEATGSGPAVGNLIHTELEPQDFVITLYHNLGNVDILLIWQLSLGGGESHVPLYGAAANFGTRAKRKLVPTPLKPGKGVPIAVSQFIIQKSRLYSLSTWHTNEEAGDEKVNTLRCFSGCVKNCKGTWYTMLLCLHTHANPSVTSDWAGGANGDI